MPITMLKARVRTLVPLGARAALRRWQRRVRLQRGLRTFGTDPGAALLPGSRLLSELVDAWANEGWSARGEYLGACVAEALACRGPILECGSGLTTLLLGLVARRRGLFVWTLEHSAEWGARVARELAAIGDLPVELNVKALRQEREFDWYDPPLPSMPPLFSLVVCDGPPHSTRGGRYGLAPTMQDRLPPGCVILLDDAARGPEQEIAARWAMELRAEYEVLGREKPYIRMALSPPGVPA